jgi:hypothetical protein
MSESTKLSVINGMCCCVICEKYSECHVLENQICPRFNCIVRYDTSEKLLVLEIIELLQLLNKLIEKTEEFTREYIKAVSGQ